GRPSKDGQATDGQLISAYKDLIASIESGWAGGTKADNGSDVPPLKDPKTGQAVPSIKAQIQAQQDLIHTLVDTGQDATYTDANGTQTKGHLESLNEKAARLQKMIGEVHDLRDRATSELNGAVDQFTNASAAAARYSTAIRNRIQANAQAADVPAMRQLIETYDPNGYRLQQANADHMLGTIYVHRALMATDLKALADQLAPILTKAGAKMPEALDTASLASEAQSAKSEADGAFAKADSLFTEVNNSVGTGQAATSRKNAAGIAAAINDVSQAQ